MKLTSFLAVVVLSLSAFAGTNPQCKKPTPTPPPTNTNSGSNAGSSSSSSSSSTANASSDAYSNQTQNQTQTQNQSNTSTNDNQSSASNNGNNSNNSTTNVEAPKIPVSTAYAPTAIPTVPCFKGYSGGVQTMAAGVSLGGGKIDEGCDAREFAREYALMGSRRAACKMLVSQKQSKKAGVTFEDCMAQDPQPVAPVPPPVPSPVQIVLPDNVPVVAVPSLPQPPEYKTEVTVTADQLIGICTFANAISCQPESGPAVITVSSICKKMLEQAKKSLVANPGSVLLIRGNHNASEDEITASSRANNVKKQLESYGVPSSRLKVEVGDGTTRTVELVLQSN